MKKKIYIEDMQIYASVGVYDHEKKSKQKILINLEIYLNDNHKILNDKLKNVTDYGVFRNIILNVLKNRHYNLIEKMTQDICKKILEINSVEKIKIKVTKLSAFKDCKVSFELSNF